MVTDPQRLLWPRPRRLTLTDGALLLGSEPTIAAAAAGEPARALLERELEKLGLGPRRAGRSQPGRSRADLLLASGAVPGSSGERYRLEVTDRGARVTAPTAEGLFRGAATLVQWIRVHRARPSSGGIPGLEAVDEPDFGYRGALLDVSRNKVPTLATLRDLIDRLAGLKINQLQLYMEHTFAYRGHRPVWQGWSPFRPHEIRELDAYCRARFIELVPNQNSFGHFHRWLIHERYRPLAECPEGVDHPFSPEPEPFSLCPLDPGALDLLRDLYDQLLPNFESRLFNVGLDETLDLGLGRSAGACRRRGRERVYLDFLKCVHELVRDRGRRMLFWGDVILNRPELIAELPRDAIALEWGYEADHPFAADGRRFARSGLEFWVCPGTSSWNSFAGRTRNAFENLASAAVHGHDQGARGYLICDWGDNGHLQPLPASYPGFAAGAGFAWNVASARESGDRGIAEILDLHVLDASGAGRILTGLGDAYLRTGAAARNGSALFFLWIFAGKPAGERRTAGLTPAGLAETLDFIDRTAAPLEGLLAHPRHRRLRDELRWTADVLRCACRLGALWSKTGLDQPLDRLPGARRRELAGEIPDLARRLRKIWLARHRPGGLEPSLARFLSVRELLIGSDA